MKVNKRICFVVLGCVFFSPIYASVYEVTPTQLSLSAKQMVGVVKITNRGHENSLLQLSLLDWQQEHGKDYYQVSNDILLTPPIFRLPPHKTQLIRFALKHPIFIAEQKAYRVHIKEVQQPRRKKLGQSLYFIMDISLPLFIQPEQITERYDWSIQRLDAEHIKLKLYNDGNVNLFVSEWQLLTDDTQNLAKKHKTFVYIFPHQSHSWMATVKSNINFTDILANLNGQRKKSILHKL
jgi:fimbrial chaperone protein